MNSGLYLSKTKTGADFLPPGFVEAFVNMLSDFTTLLEPVLSDPPVLGEKYTIGSAHTWASGKGAIDCWIDKDTAEAAGATNGAKNSLVTFWTPKIFIKGDGAKILETIENLKNEDLIIFLKMSCDNDTYIQFGCKCTPVNVTKVTGGNGTLKGSAGVGYLLECETIEKTFYTAALTLRT